MGRRYRLPEPDQPAAPPHSVRNRPSISRRTRIASWPASKTTSLQRTARPARHVVPEDHVVGEPDRQGVLRQRVGRRHQLAVDGEAALAVEPLARPQGPLGGGGDVAAPVARRPRRLAADRDGGDRDPELQADQVIRLVGGGEAAAGVGLEPVLGEAVAHVGARRLEHRVDAPAQVPEHRPAVALQRRDHLDGAALGEAGRRRPRAQDARQVVDAAGREGEAVARRGEPAGIGHRGHLQRRLGAVEEGVEHLRVEVAARDLALAEAVMAPDRVGRGGVVGRQVLGALAGADHLEPDGARPVDQLGDQGRLVAGGHGVDHPGLGGLARQQRPGQHVGLDVDHHDVLARREGLERVADAGRRAAGGVDDDVHERARDHRVGILGDEGGAGLRGLLQSRAPRSGRRPSRPARSDARARSGDRSATAIRWMPGVRGACDRYIEPNLPAPIRPTRTGRPSLARRCSLANRDMVGSPWAVHGRSGSGPRRARIVASLRPTPSGGPVHRKARTFTQGTATAWTRRPAKAASAIPGAAAGAPGDDGAGHRPWSETIRLDDTPPSDGPLVRPTSPAGPPGCPPPRPGASCGRPGSSPAPRPGRGSR